MATDCSFAKISRPKYDFLRLLSWQTIGFLEFLPNLTPIIMKEGTNFAAGIDFISSAHF